MPLREVSLLSSLIAAILAEGRLFLKPLLFKEALLAATEQENLAAIPAHQRPICKLRVH